MTPEEQEARRLINDFALIISGENKKPIGLILKIAKQCAIKVCEEKIKTIVELSEGKNGYWLDVIQKQIDIKTAINNYEQ